MSERRRLVVLRLAAAIGGASAFISAVLGIVELGLDKWFTEFGFFMAVYALFFAVFTWLAAPGQSNNPVVWIMGASAFFGGTVEIGYLAAGLLFETEGELLTLTEYIPASLPTAGAWAVMATGWTWVPALLPQLTFGMLLFPDGRLPSPRWRWLGVMAAGAIVTVTFASAWSFRPWSTVPAEESTLLVIGFTLAFVAAVLSLVALVIRFRRSSGHVRHQIKWVLFGTSVFVPMFMGVGFTLGGTEYEYLLFWPVMLAEMIFLGCYGFAVVKYRLYDVDVIISRAFVYGTLAVFITAVYVGIVVGLGVLLGAQDEFWLGVGATVVIAIGFQPLRRQLQKVANRMVYGRRATPYEVLSSFSQGVAAVDPAVLRQVAQSLTEGTTATAASIWVERSAQYHRIAGWPDDRSTVDGVPGGDRLEDITHDGERLGLISLTLPPGQPFPPTDEALLEQVSAGLGLALRNLRLTDDLQARVDQLRESRRRIVAVQDKTRQELERDLHDGAQQRLVALKIKVGIGATMAEKEGLEDVRQILSTVKEETDLTIDSLRTLARGIYPPLLDAEGLGPALTTQLHRMPVPVTVQAAGVGRHPREIEATIYFCVLEAVQNTVKHAQAQSVLVSVTEADGRLGFEIRDDGIGFDPDRAPRGQGLINLTDRLDAVGGTMEIESEPGHGTVVKARVPVSEGVSV